MQYPLQRRDWKPRATIPAKPLRFALIDRQTGAFYRIKPTVAEDGPELQVVASVPTPWVSALIDAYVVGDTGRQLYVSGATLLSEAAPAGVHGARALVWLGNKVFEIDFDADGTQTWAQILP